MQRNFDGHIYELKAVYHTKEEAEHEAEWERSADKLVRITKQFSGYYVWTKKKSPYG